MFSAKSGCDVKASEMLWMLGNGVCSLADEEVLFNWRLALLTVGEEGFLNVLIN